MGEVGTIVLSLPWVGLSRGGVANGSLEPISDGEKDGVAEDPPPTIGDGLQPPVANTSRKIINLQRFLNLAPHFGSRYQIWFTQSQLNTRRRN